jgi:hypothetical protein
MLKGTFNEWLTDGKLLISPKRLFMRYLEAVLNPNRTCPRLEEDSIAYYMPAFWSTIKQLELRKRTAVVSFDLALANQNNCRKNQVLDGINLIAA